MAPFRTGRAPGHYAMRFARQNAEAQRAKGEASEFSKERRASWARLLRTIFEVDPLLCPCGAEMKIISVITDSRARGSDSGTSPESSLHNPRSLPAAPAEHPTQRPRLPGNFACSRNAPRIEMPIIPLERLWSDLWNEATVSQIGATYKRRTSRRVMFSYDGISAGYPRHEPPQERLPPLVSGI